MIAKINPGELHTPPGYHHVTIVEAGRTAHLAGQCPVGLDGLVVGVGNLGAQIDQVVANSMVALGAAGASPEDVIRTVIYVVSDQVDVLGAAWDQLCDSELGAAFTTASTLLGVAQLGFPGQLIEVDLTAALRLLGTALGARGSGGLARGSANFGGTSPPDGNLPVVSRRVNFREASNFRLNLAVAPAGC
jgi:enamine deaminase RidA (YjgF/YER057c/UK114 family)